MQVGSIYRLRFLLFIFKCVYFSHCRAGFSLREILTINMSAANPHVSLPGDERVELAIDEGHDADIPTNVGSINEKDLEKEIELDSKRRFSDSQPSFTYDVEKDATAVSTKPSDGVAVAEDPNVVFWDGPDDPQNPLNWSRSAKWGSIAVVSGITFLSPLGSAMVAPGVPGIMKTFDSHSELLSGFIVSIYVLGYVFGPLSERRSPSPISKLEMANTCSHRTNVRDVGTPAPLSFLPGPLRCLQPWLRFEHQYGHASRFPFSCWLRWRLTPNPRWWNNRGPYSSRTARRRNGDVGTWPDLGSYHRPCCWWIHLRLSRLAVEFLDLDDVRWSQHGPWHLSNARDLCSCHPAEEDEEAPKRNWQHGPTLEARHRTHPESTV